MDIKDMCLMLILPLMAVGCSTAPKSILAGGISGGVAGALMGQQQSGSSEGSAIGAVVGAGIGSLIGYLSFNEKQKKDAVKSNPEIEIPDEWTPFITRPKIRSYVVPDTIEGNKFIKSHRIFILESGGEWSR